MQSYKTCVDNPWNLFISKSDNEKIENKFDGVKSTGCILEHFLSSSLPVSFTRSRNVVNCQICNVLVIKNRFKQHYKDRHCSDTSIEEIMIPFDDNVSVEKKSRKLKKMKRNRKKRVNYKETVKYPQDLLDKGSSKKTNKIRPINKRHHSKCFLDGGNYFSKTKKLKLGNIEALQENKSWSVTDEGFMSSSSTKNIDDNLYVNSNTTFDGYRVYRTSSDSSTPPSLSLGTVHTVSSPSSFTILNDPSSVNTEHYFLPSNDLTSTDRSALNCKYHIDSLPWENLPANDTFSSSVPRDSFIDLVPGYEDGEVERAVQSITNLCDGFSDRTAQQKLSLFTPEEASIIDCFLDEVLDCAVGYPSHLAPNNSCQTSVTDECGQSSSEYRIDSSLHNSITSDNEDKFEVFINDTMTEFITQSPHNVSTNDRKKLFDCFDPLKHCGVVSSTGVLCHRSLLCKLHTMPQKRQVHRPQSLTALIKGIRDLNKMKRLHKKEAQTSTAFTSCNSSTRTSNDSLTYNCSSTRSTEEASSFMDTGLSTPDLDMSVFTSMIDSGCAQPVPGPLAVINETDPCPLVTSRFKEETVVHGNRSMIATKSLMWRHRPRSNCNSFHILRKSDSTYHDVADQRDMCSASSSSAHLPSINNGNNTMQLSQSFCGNYVLSNDGQDQFKGSITPGHNSDRDRSTIFTQQSMQGMPNNSLSSSKTLASNFDLNFSGANGGVFMNVGSQLTSSTSSSFNVTNNGSIVSEIPPPMSKFISIADESSGGGSGSNFYPVMSGGNGSQIMMLMNKSGGGAIYTDHQDMLPDHLGVAGNNVCGGTQHLTTSLPTNSFLTLKQNIQQHDNNGSLSTPQFVSISSLDLQRFSDPFGGPISTNQIHLATTDCADKPGPIIYQLNQAQASPANFVSSSLATVNEYSCAAKPLTVQSSSINGMTQKFVILPDGTISAFTQPANAVKTANFNQPIFNYGTSNQAYFINHDPQIAIIGTASTPVQPQHLLMPPLLNNQHNNDLINNSSASSSLAFIHPQSAEISQLTSNRPMHNNLQLTQIPVDSSQQKLSFQCIQTPTQYQNSIPNTFFIAAAHPTAGVNIPLKQQIFVQSSEQLAPDMVLMDSTNYSDMQGNGQYQCTSMTDQGDSGMCIISNGSGQHDFLSVSNCATSVAESFMMPQKQLQLQSSHANRCHDRSGTSQCSTTNNSDGAQQHMVPISSSNHYSKYSIDHVPLTQQKLSTGYLYQEAPGHPTRATAPMSGTLNASTYKSTPPPLVISQQLLNQSLGHTLRQKSFKDPSSYQSVLLQQQQPAPVQLYQTLNKTTPSTNQLQLDDGQFSNEYMIVQSMIA